MFAKFTLISARLRRIRFSLLLSMIFCTTVISAVGCVGYFALSALYGEKKQDVWAIMYLNLEQQSRSLVAALIETSKSKTPDFVLAIEEQKIRPINSIDERLSADISQKLKDTEMPIGSLHLFSSAGNAYIAKITANDLQLYPTTKKLMKIWHVDIEEILKPTSSARSDSITYLSSRSADLVYSSSEDVVAASLERRTIVQQFAASPLSQGQIEFVDPEGKVRFGFFYDMPELNSVIFSEVLRSNALSVVTSFARRLLLLSLIVIIISLLVVQILLRYSNNHLHHFR